MKKKSAARTVARVVPRSTLAIAGKKRPPKREKISPAELPPPDRTLGEPGNP